MEQNKKEKIKAVQPKRSTKVTQKVSDKDKKIESNLEPKLEDIQLNMPAENETKVAESKPAKVYTKNQIIAVSALGYIIFFLPFIFCKEEPFARFHHNQALGLWIICCVLYLAFVFIPNVNVVAIPIILMIHLLGMSLGVAGSLRGKANKILFLSSIPIIKVKE